MNPTDMSPVLLMLRAPTSTLHAIPPRTRRTCGQKRTKTDKSGQIRPCRFGFHDSPAPRSMLHAISQRAKTWCKKVQKRD
jgi:hypothetical protein